MNEVNCSESGAAKRSAFDQVVMCDNTRDRAIRLSRERIDGLIEEYKQLLTFVVDGRASEKQKDFIRSVLSEISSHTDRVFRLHSDT